MAITTQSGIMLRSLQTHQTGTHLHIYKNKGRPRRETHATGDGARNLFKWIQKETRMLPLGFDCEIKQILNPLYYSRIFPDVKGIQ
uniref:Putative ovule protein n=1 Tax=Solanum chacoense TaxID=4108 RepID=A0A0V0HPR8_SOLCH